MLKIKNDNGVEVCVKFYHGEVQGSFLDYGGKPVGRRYCSAVADIDGHIVGQAESVCHPADPYVKKTGRKVAFEKLLSYMDLSRETRRAAWERFWAYGKPPAPDANCITRADGACISTEPCMHSDMTA